MQFDISILKKSVGINLTPTAEDTTFVGALHSMFQIHSRGHIKKAEENYQCTSEIEVSLNKKLFALV